jgi:hypothetical protein
MPASKYLRKTVLPYDIVLLHFSLLIYVGEQIKKNEMGGACGTYGEEERLIQGFVGEPNELKKTLIATDKDCGLDNQRYFCSRGRNFSPFSSVHHMGSISGRGKITKLTTHPHTTMMKLDL